MAPASRRPPTNSSSSPSSSLEAELDDWPGVTTLGLLFVRSGRPKTAMRRTVQVLATCVLVARAITIGAQDDPVVGTWSGTLTAGQRAESTLSITIVRRDGRYAGVTTALDGTSEVELTQVSVDGRQVSITASADSELGQVSLAGDLTVEDTRLIGSGTLSVGDQRVPVSFALQRRPRTNVPQPQVEQGLDYFVGRWEFEYLGSEFPPLSVGTRTGTVAFSPVPASEFVTGDLTADLYGNPYTEHLTLGFDSQTKTLVLQETRSHGTDLVSLGNWQSPIAISFITAPVEADGRTYRLRRILSIRSETSFGILEEFSVDEGPYRRLGNAQFSKVE